MNLRVLLIPVLLWSTPVFAAEPPYYGAIKAMPIAFEYALRCKRISEMSEQIIFVRDKLGPVNFAKMMSAPVGSVDSNEVKRVMADQARRAGRETCDELRLRADMWYDIKLR